MSQNFDTTIGLSADFSSAGQPFDFDGAFVTNLVITNNSGVGIQFTPDGTTWATINPAGSASPTVPDSTSFYLRKMAAGGAPASVRLQWRSRDSIDPTSPAVGPYITQNNANRLNYRKAFAKVLAGQRARLLILGDSTTAGAGAGANTGGTTGMVGARAKNWPSRLATALTAMGIPAYSEAVFGDQGLSGASETYAAYDPRVNVGTWTTQNINSVGAYAWTTSASGATWAFTPGMTFDRFDVYTTTFPGLGGCTVNVDGGATLATISANAASGIVKTAVTCTRGTHTINVVSNSTSGVFLLGVVPWDSTVGGLDIIQGAYWGGKMTNMAQNSAPWHICSATNLTAIAPDLAVIQLTINDSNNNTAAATYATQLATVEAAMATAGAETLLMSGIPSNFPQTTSGQLASLAAAVQARAAGQARVYADLGLRCGSYGAMNAIGWMFDDVHGSANLYADEARWLAQTLLAEMQ